jgi:hypothetical protein
MPPRTQRAAWPNAERSPAEGRRITKDEAAVSAARWRHRRMTHQRGHDTATSRKIRVIEEISDPHDGNLVADISSPLRQYPRITFTTSSQYIWFVEGTLISGRIL